MALQAKDLGSLAVPLGVLATVAALCGAAIWFSSTQVKAAKANLAKAETQLKEAAQRVRSSGDERDVIYQYLTPYRELQQRGFVGEAQRVNWIDALRIANGEAQLYGANYEISAPQPYAFSKEVEAGALPVEQWTMKLKMGLLYEDDLLRFLRVLAAQGVGTFNVTQCGLQRLKKEIARPTNEPTLNAECELAWVTIPAPASEAGGS